MGNIYRNHKGAEKDMKILYLPDMYSQQRQHEKKRWIYPILMAMEATYYREQGFDVKWDEPLDNSYNNSDNKIVIEPEGLPFLSLPQPDRLFTNAFNKRYQNNGNFKYHPGTYIQAASGCWHGKCSFCVEKGKPYEVRPVEDVIEEIKECKALGFKEVFDDSGTFPVGKWLDNFCRRLEPLKIRFSCNARLVDSDYRKLHSAGFRMLLFGIESGNQKTLDRINKGVQIEDIKYVIRAAKAGLEPHVAVMFGHPGESDSDAENTLRLVWWLLKKGYAKTAQASFYSVPGVVGKESSRKYIKQIYRVATSPTFWLNKLRDIHNVADLKYLWRQIKEGLNGLNTRQKDCR